MIKNNRYYPYGDYIGFPITKGKCPKCESALYKSDGDDQGGIPFVKCTNDTCTYIKY